MSWDTLDYSTAKLGDSVVVLGAGASTHAHMDDIQKYIADNNSIVYSASYNFDPILSDYTYLNDVEKISTCITKLRSGVIISARLLEKLPRKGYNIEQVTKKMMKRGVKVWSIGSTRRGAIGNIYKGMRIDFDVVSGRFNHFTLGNAGFGAIASSLVSRPKKMLIVGIDGHIPGKKRLKMCFDGVKMKKVKSVPPHKIKQCVDYLNGALFPYLKKQGICVEIFDDVGLWGVKKERFGIRTLD